LPGASDCARCGALFEGDKAFPPPRSHAPSSPSEVREFDRSAYLLSGFFFCLSSSILVGFPLGAALGNGPGYWFLAAAGLTAISYAYTAMPKGQVMVEFNFFALVAFFLFIATLTASVSPRGGGDWFAVLMLSAFTLGLPLILPIACLIWHGRKCLGSAKRIDA